ncbi:hypothetical protein ACJRO7_020342 [Eucalyptus globulus]|uniref:Uncharacterized protein n=1 Tax=Eucalyptus globulus TaxID=34317 RepID=A0ABD3KGF5_EUCGL
MPTRPPSYADPRLPLRSLHPPTAQKPPAAAAAAAAAASSLPRSVFKAVLVALLLVAVPFFPSQAPAFLDHRVFTEFWELLHLLFIGLAVSYGLFSRRNRGDGGPEGAERPPVPAAAAWSASRVGDFLSIFEDGYELSCGPDGKIQRPAQEAWKWDAAHYSQGESKVAFGEETDFASEEQLKSRSLSSENGDAVVSSWSSQCFPVEPMVVVAQPNFNLGDEYSKPLGLPVRSLRSRTGEPSRRKSRNGGGSVPVSGASHSSISSDGHINGDFGDVGPVNLEKKLDETMAVPPDSAIPGQPRFERMGVRESFNNGGKRRHARHISAEESRFRHHRSRSLKSNGSLSSRTGSASSSSSPDKLSPLHFASSDLPKVEDPWNKKDQFPSSHAASPLDACGPFDVSGYEKGVGRNLTDKDDYGENVIHNSFDSKSTFYSSSMNRKVSPDMSHSQRNEKILLEKLNDERMDLSEKRSQEFSGHKLPPRGSHSRSYTSIEKFNDEQMDFSEKRYQEFSGDKLPPLGSHSRSYTSNEKLNNEQMDLSEKRSQEEFSGHKLPPRGSHSRSYTSIEQFNDEPMAFSEKRYQEFSGGKLPPLGSQSRSYTSIEKLNDEQMDLSEKSSQEEFSGNKLPPRGSHCRSYTSIDTFLDGDGQRKLKDNREDPGCISGENLSHRRGLPQGSLKLDVKSREKNIKGTPRGRSVRTFRACRQTETVDQFEEACRKFIDDKVGMKHEKTDHFGMRKEGKKTKGSQSSFSSAGQPTLGNSSPVLQQEFADCANGETNHRDNKRVNSGGEWMAEAENPQRRLDKEAMSDCLSDAGTEANEVDKKAGEFIAKFREQIRRQKMASIGSLSVDFSEDDYR